MISQINVSSPSNEILYTDSAAGNNIDAIKASSTKVFWAVIDNSLNSAESYLRLWNVASGSVSNGTTPPNFIAYVPGLSIVTVNFGTSAAPGLVFGTALSASVVSNPGQTGSTSPLSAVTFTLSYV